MNAPTLREELRAALVPNVANFATHDTISTKLKELGLAGVTTAGSKKERVEAAFAMVHDNELPRLAENYLTRYRPATGTRNRIQDFVWATQAPPEIPKRIRRELARSLTDPLFQDGDEFMALLDRLWVLDDNFLAFFENSDRSSLRGRIKQHLFSNSDWDAETLFGELGAFNASDRRLGLFLEGLASAEVLLDEAAQRAFVKAANKTLLRCNVELRETGSAGGYPVFRIARTTGGPSRKPKNLIFASSTKPDLRLNNAVDNDIEVVSDAAKVLIYEEPIGDGGLTWNDLQAWWSKIRSVTDPVEAKKGLYRRLKDCLPTTSPPQKAFFDAYHRCFSRDIPTLPALLPEVWLHWDHKTVVERGADALLRFRMDFLMLLPNRGRVVIEIDGKQHYADAAGRADPARYATMVQADREQKLAGYEIYRFGAAELATDAATEVAVSEFFQSLFDRHHVPYSTPSTSAEAPPSAVRP